MARDYGRIHTAFWNSPVIRGLNDRGKLLANYLLSGPHSNSIGAYLLPDAYISDDLGWTAAAVRDALADVIKAGFAKRFADGRHIVICKFMEWNPIENPNVGKAAIRQLEHLPVDPCVEPVIEGIESALKRFPNGFGTVPERFRNTKPYPKPETNPEPKPEMDDSAAPLALAPSVIALPTNRFHSSGEEFGFSQSILDDYSETFPAVDIPQQFRQMRQWLIDNPERRKTLGGMTKFVNRWLSKEQDKGNGQPGRKPTPHENFAIGGFAAAADAI